MLRRLLAQFGLTTLVVALGAGVVFADSPPSTPTSNNNDTGQTVVSNDASGVTISASGTATTTVGPSSNGSGGSVGPTAPPSTNGSLTPGASDDAKTVSGGNGASSNGGSNQGPTSTNPSLTHSDSDQTSSLPLSSNSTPAQPTMAASHNSFVASIERTAYISGLSPIVPVAMAALPGIAHHHTPPPAPPVGLLYQLHVLLISTLVPASKVLPAAAMAIHTSATGLLLSLLALTVVMLARGQLTLLAGYAARLRQSGFLGAARSDVGGALFSFATPREMSFIAANAP